MFNQLIDWLLITVQGVLKKLLMKNRKNTEVK